MIYTLVFFGTLLLSLLAMALVRGAYAKYSNVPASSGLTGAEVAHRILSVSGIRDVDIQAIPGTLTDHYDPTRKVLNLSEANYYGRSLAAIGVSAHECGHAIQHQHNYAPLNWRMAAVGITSFASNMLGVIMLLSFVGMFLHIVLPMKAMMVGMALAFFIIMLFQLVTLPVEFDATARAKRIVAKIGAIAPGEETVGMNRVLDAAALTYVAAFISALAQFLYYFISLLNSRN